MCVDYIYEFNILFFKHCFLLTIHLSSSTRLEFFYRQNAELQVTPPIFLAATPVGAGTMTFFDIDGMLLLLYWRLIRSTRMHATKTFPVRQTQVSKEVQPSCLECAALCLEMLNFVLCSENEYGR